MNDLDIDDLYAAFYCGGYGAAMVEAWEKEDKQNNGYHDDEEEKVDDDE